MSELSHARDKDPIRPWFEALESLGDYTTFRFGHVAPGAEEPRWHEFPHKLYDGIGGFAHMLREADLEIPALQVNRHPSEPSWWPFLRALPAVMGPRRRLKWRELETGPELPPGPLPDPVISWHVFEEEESTAIRTLAREAGVTINSYLLKHLDNTLREEIEDHAADIPWMVPVNLRGKIDRGRDTENHSSYLAIRISPKETVRDLHQDIYRRLDRGEHWIAWKGYTATRFLPQALKRLALKTDRAMTQWNLGLFTNLGVWDPDKTITDEDYRGAWVVLATVLRSQMVGAACITFQGRLSISLQVHPELTTSPAVPKRWMKGWLERIKGDLASEPAEEPASAPQAASAS